MDIIYQSYGIQIIKERLAGGWLDDTFYNIMMMENVVMETSLAESNELLNTEVKDLLFPKSYELLPNSHEAWDWEMAYMERQTLSKTELIDRSAFFARVDGIPTYHYRMCRSTDTSIHSKKSIYTRSFFLANQFSTGYATHGLFPYRGKFHPQMVKGLFNIIGIKPGAVILDPMAGSCTACVEAKIMGINSIGIDLSPFCVLMGNAKSFATSMNVESINRLEHLLPKVLKALETENKLRENLQCIITRNSADPAEEGGFVDLIMLAFLDSVGYARRSKRKLARGLLSEVFTRYLLTVRSFINFIHTNKPSVPFADAKISVGSVLDLKLPSNTVDCVLTSPPYSFAIDYIDNDAPQLQIMGVDIDPLKQNMIGLRGKTRDEKIRNYFKDMALAFKEMSRVLKPGKFCVIIVGSNSIQTGGIKHEEEFKALANKADLELIRDMVKPIKGIQNTLHEEHVMFFKKKHETD
jgi:tRNA G10  N-methylase Trm11